MSNSSIFVYFVNNIIFNNSEKNYIDFENQMIMLKGKVKLFLNNAKTIGNNKHHEENNLYTMFYRLILTYSKCNL